MLYIEKMRGAEQAPRIFIEFIRLSRYQLTHTAKADLRVRIIWTIHQYEQG